MKRALIGLLGILFIASQTLAQPATQPTSQPGAAGRAGGRGRGAGGARGGGARGPDMAAFYRLSPDSTHMDGVPQGKYVGPITLPSNVYPGNTHTYWVYVPAQYDPAIPTALMIFNDGQAFKKEPGDIQAHNVLDNLIYRREIPVMLGVFINPGRLPTEPEPPGPTGDWGDGFTRRPEEYNGAHDKYARVIVEELLPALYKDYNISKDPEMHAIGGSSSGGVAAFTVAWERPNDFRKMFSFSGSYTLRGGYVYPEKIAESEKKPIRVYMQDGRNDSSGTALNNNWFYQNVRLKDALVKKGYDVNWSWGIGPHGQKQGGQILPEIMHWLWRDAQVVDPDPNNRVEKSYRGPATAPAAAPQ